MKNNRLRKSLVNISIGIFCASMAQSAFAEACSLKDMNVGNNPYGGKQFMTAYGQINLTFNHVVPKGSEGTLFGAQNIIQAYSKISDDASNQTKENFIIALREQLVVFLGKKHTDKYNVTSYQDQKLTSPMSSVRTVNRLLLGINRPDLCIPFAGVGKVKDCYVGEKEEDTIVLSKDDSNIKKCHTFRNDATALFVWNPVNGFYSPDSSTRSWDPSINVDDKFDYWAYHVAQNYKTVIDNLKTVYTCKNCTGDTIGNALINAINTVSTNGGSGELSGTDKFIPDNWVKVQHNGTMVNRVWGIKDYNFYNAQ